MKPASLAAFRILLAFWLPGILAAAYALTVFEDGWPGRAVLAVLFGGFVQVAAMIAYAAAVYVSAKLAGENSEPINPLTDRANPRLTGALLLAVFVYVLGIHWREQVSQRIARCVQEETGGTSELGQFATAGDLIYHCTHEYDRSYPDDDY